jgi:hypothetical protein
VHGLGDDDVCRRRRLPIARHDEDGARREDRVPLRRQGGGYARREGGFDGSTLRRRLSARGRRTLRAAPSDRAADASRVVRMAYPHSVKEYAPQDGRGCFAGSAARRLMRDGTSGWPRLRAASVLSLCPASMRSRPGNDPRAASLPKRAGRSIRGLMGRRRSGASAQQDGVCTQRRPGRRTGS